MNSRNVALQMVTVHGFRVIRVAENGKKPIEGENWQKRSLDDPLAIIETWPETGYNVGIHCKGLVVLDVDVRDGKPGMENLAKLPALPNTFTVRTPSGGLHIYFSTPEGVEYRNSPGSLPPGIDVRGAGGQVLAPGSMIDGVDYKIVNNAPVAPAPLELLTLLNERRSREEKAGCGVIGELDTDENLADARDYLAKRAPSAVQGARDDTAVLVANHIYDCGVSEATCRELLDEWNAEKCAPPLEDSDLDRIAESALNSRENPVGCKSVSAFGEGFEPIPESPKTSPSDLLEYDRDVELSDVLRQNENAIIKGLLYFREDAILYGDSTAGKTFAALDMAWAIAQGRPWCGRRVKRCPVLYVALEGVHGFRKRMVAASRVHGGTEGHFARLKVNVSLVRAENGKMGADLIVSAFKQLLADAGAANGLIIVDTMARAMAGDNENDTADVMHFFEHRTGYIRQATGAAALIVHHSNRAGSVRGSSAAKASTDVMIRAERDDKGGARRLIAEKVKDGIEGTLLTYRLKIIDLGEDADGDAVTSCVVDTVPDPNALRAVECQTLVRTLLTDAILDGRNLSPNRRAAADPDTKEPRYAPKWLRAHGAEGFELEEIESAISVLSPPFFVEKYDSRGREADRYALADDATLPATTEFSQTISDTETNN